MQSEAERDEKKVRYKRTSELSLQDYVRIVFVRKWLVLPIFLLFVSASVYYIKTSPPVYQSRVLMMRESASRRLPADVIGFSLAAAEVWDGSQELLLKSFSSLAEIKQRLSEEYDSEVAVEQLRKGISLSRYKESSTVLEMTATAGTPEEAQAIASTAADTYITKMTEMKRNELNQGLGFLERQMQTVEERIQETEKALSDFQDEEGLIFASETASSGLLERLGKIQSELIQTESDIELAKSQLESINELISEKKKYAQSSSVTELSPQIDQLQQRLVSLQLELNTKLETLTEKDPEVIAVQKKVDVMQGQLKTEFDRLLKAPGVNSLDPISELQSLMQQSITLNVQLRGLERKAKLVTERMDRFRAEHPELISKQIELARLERQARVYEQTYVTLMSKYEDMRLLEQMKTSGLKLIDIASLPKSPISPKKKQALAIGILLGLSMGIGIAFFLEYLDDSIKRKEDVERFLELPVMGAIPKIEPFDAPKHVLERSEGNVLIPHGQSDSPSNIQGADANRSPALLKSRSNPSHVGKGSRHRGRYSERTRQALLNHSLLYAPSGSGKDPGIESYRNLAANIRYADIDNPIKSLLVTSATPSEGKTITASNLAFVMAQSGMKVLLIDADLRRPNLHRIFQQDRAPGLSDLLISDDGWGKSSVPLEDNEGELSGSALRDFIRPTTADNLYLLPCGVRVSNPGMLFPSERMKNLIGNVARHYDLTIFDSPPLGSVADAVALSTEVDGTLMVIRSGKTKRKIGLQGKESLESVNAEVIGAVLNNVDYAKQYGYYYYYHRYYSYYRYYSHDSEDESE